MNAPSRREGGDRLAGPKVVALGGGHGLAASLSALRHIAGRLTAVVTVADDGGSSGRLRRELGVLPPGDLRMALAALCGDDEWGHTWARVLQHRFEGAGSLQGHAVGNILISALWELLDEHVAGLDWVGRLLGAQGRVLPMTVRPVTIEAMVGSRSSEDRDVKVIEGQHAIATTSDDVIAVRLSPEAPPACPEALEAVEEADWAVLGPGSWFTSVIPHLLVPQLRDALAASPAKIAVTLNLSESGETRGFTPEAHLELLTSYAPDLHIDTVIAHTATVGKARALNRLTDEMGAELVVADVAASDDAARHDPQRLQNAYAHALVPRARHERIASWQ